MIGNLTQRISTILLNDTWTITVSGDSYNLNAHRAQVPVEVDEAGNMFTAPALDSLIKELIAAVREEHGTDWTVFDSGNLSVA